MKGIVNAIDLKHGAERIQLARSPRMGGCTVYDGKTKRVIGMQLPAENNAYTRTIRLHELIHAQKQGFPTREQSNCPAWQTIMDIRVHTVNWPEDLPESANRDATVAALTDLRALDPKDWAEPGAWITTVTMAARASAILQTTRDRKARKLAEKRLNRLFPEAFQETLNIAVEDAQGNKSQQKAARELLIQLMNLQPEEEEGKGKPGSGKGKEDFGKAEGKAPPYMELIELPMREDCLPSPTICPARSGMRLNRNRLTRAVVNNSTAGLFLKVRPLTPQGTVLFDASGSMEVDSEKLSELCRSAPGATIGYYSGDKDTGKLVVYAKNGKRFAEEALPYHDSGNAVDLPAVQWLLAQEGPRILVSDLDFCGGKEGDAQRALALVTQQQGIGELLVIDSVGNALEVFRMKAAGY